MPEEACGSSPLDGGSVGPPEGALVLSGLGEESQTTERQELALVVSDGKPEPADTRELAQGIGSNQMELMLAQVIEENRFLRRRLEQADAGLGW